MTRAWFVLAGVLIGASHLVVASQPKYKAIVKAVQPAALAKARTYAWTASHPSFDKAADHLIVAAVDRELAARGFTKLPTGPGDVVVTYASLSKTHVDLKSKVAKGGPYREFLVGTLVVDLSDPASRQLLFRVQMDMPIEKDPAALETAINAVVTAMFDKYPTPKH